MFTNLCLDQKVSQSTASHNSLSNRNSSVSNYTFGDENQSNIRSSIIEYLPDQSFTEQLLQRIKPIQRVICESMVSNTEQNSKVGVQMTNKECKFSIPANRNTISQIQDLSHMPLLRIKDSLKVK